MTNDEKLIFACEVLSQRMKESPASFVLDSPLLTTVAHLTIARGSTEYQLPKPGVKQLKTEIAKSARVTIQPFVDTITPLDFYQAKNLVTRIYLGGSKKMYASLYLSEIIQASTGSVSYLNDIFNGDLNGILAKPRTWLIAFADMMLEEQKQEERKLYVQPEFSLYGRW